MKILITGGAGFIGSHVAERLLARGDTALVIDNYATGRRDNLTPHPNLRVVEGTIADAKLVNNIFAEFNPDVVLHAAASFKDPDNWQEDATTNTLGTAIVVQATKRTEVKRLIYLQTALCYGLHPKEQPITLKHPLYPEGSSYSITKTAGENFIVLSGLEFISFRLANAYGPRNLTGPLPTFYSRLTNNKPCFAMDTRRDFIYIQDMVDLIVMAIDGKGSKGIYHISSGSDYSVKELFDATVKALGIKLDREVEVRPRGPDDAYTILLDPGKTIQDFGWKTKTALEVGVRKTIEWYKKYGISQTYTHLRTHEEKK
jgi:UDP-glucose 4-epimerase